MSTPKEPEAKKPKNDSSESDSKQFSVVISIHINIKLIENQLHLIFHFIFVEVLN